MTTKDEPARAIVTGASRKTMRLHLAVALANMAANAVAITPSEPKPINFPFGITGKHKAQWKQETYGRKLK